MIRAGAIGFAGGWVLERWPGRHPARRCALAVVMTAALFLAIGWALAGMIALDPVFVYGGWALGLVLWPQADAVWGASRRGAADAEAEHAGRGR